MITAAYTQALNGLTALGTVPGWSPVQIQSVLEELLTGDGDTPSAPTLAALQQAATVNPTVQGLLDHWTTIRQLLPAG